MKNRTCALFLFDGYADWEPALAICGLNIYGDFRIVSFSGTGQPIVSTGGLTIQPEKSVSDISADDIDLLLLPGGDPWEQDAQANQEIIPLVQSMVASRKPVAAICGATILLGNLGLLDATPHTSNGLAYVKQHCPAYTGDAFYVNQPSVTSNGIITANGAGIIEFAHEIFSTFRILDEPTLAAVKDLYKSGGMDTRLFAMSAG